MNFFLLMEKRYLKACH